MGRLGVGVTRSPLATTWSTPGTFVARAVRVNRWCRAGPNAPRLTLEGSRRSGQDASFLDILMGVRWMRGGHEHPQGSPHTDFELLKEGNPR